jgi:hypothetical protein
VSGTVQYAIWQLERPDGTVIFREIFNPYLAVWPPRTPRDGVWAFADVVIHPPWILRGWMSDTGWRTLAEDGRSEVTP